MQMQAIASLFDETQLLVPVDFAAQRRGEGFLAGHNLSVVPLSLPKGRGIGRKLLLVAWCLRHVPSIVGAIRRADAVHAPIPGDIGTIGILLALAMRKPVFVRHCGNWRAARTVAERCWRVLLERIANEHRVVFATGGERGAPSRRNRSIRWIFSTSLSERELVEYARPRVRLPGGTPRLIISCRQDRRKGTGTVIAALPQLARVFPGITLTVLGEGPDLDAFRAEARSLGVIDRVNFAGKVGHDAVIAHLHHADVFCFPTQASEGFPKAVLEALACGVPVVTTPLPVLQGLVGEGGGTLINEPCAEQLAGAVQSVLNDERRYVAMSRAGIETAKKYSLERWTQVIGQRLTAGWGALQAHA